MKPKVSVIVPVYNAERFLARCVDSILSQTFKDFELILVDDGSPDRSCFICDEYARLDSRVHVIHKKNGGVSSARNVGIEASNGEWISFIDSDDYLINDSFFSIFSNIQSEVDIIHFGYKRELSDRSMRDFFHFDTAIFVDKYDLFSEHLFSSCSVSYFYRKSHIEKNKLRFCTQIKFSEDLDFIIRCILFTKCSVLLLPNVSYVYSYNIASATHMKIEYNRCRDHLVVLDREYTFIETKKLQLPQKVNIFISSLIINNFLYSVLTMCSKCDLNAARNDLRQVCLKHRNIDTSNTDIIRFIKTPYIYAICLRFKVSLRKMLKKI